MTDFAVRLWQRAERYPARAVLLAIAIATIGRLAYVVYLGDDIGGPDGPTYDQMGWELARYGPLAKVSGLPYWPPGFPFLVASHYALLDHHPFAVKLTQTAMIGLLTWLTYRLATRVAGPRVALVTGLGMSASLAWLALAHPLMYEPWTALPIVAALLLLLRSRDQQKAGPALAAGLLVGMAAVLSDKFLWMTPLLAIWLIVVGRREGLRRWRAALMLCAAVTAVVLPFVVRNVVVYGEPIILASNHGVNLLIGNNPDATGYYTGIDPNPPWCPGIYIFDDEWLATDRALFECAIRQAVEHPGHELAILPMKFARFWGPFIGPWADINNWRHFFDFRAALPTSVGMSGWFDGLDRAVSQLWVIGNVVLAAAGGWLLLRGRDRGAASLVAIPILFLIVGHLITFGEPRFRIPVLPLIWMLQATALVRLAHRLGRARITDMGSPRVT